MVDNPAWRHGAAHPAPRSQPTSPDWRVEVEAIASRLGRLGPDAHHPDRYFEEKSEIIGALRRIARSG